MSAASNSNVPVPSRGSAFNVKGFRKGTTDEYVQQTFSTLLPGSFICLWEVKQGKQSRRVGRMSVTPEIMRVYPEFEDSLKNPGKSVRVDVGPFELSIWTRKPKKAPKRTNLLEREIADLKQQMKEQFQSQLQTQAMLDHLLEPGRDGVDAVRSESQKRPPKRSPAHKRLKVVTSQSEEMQLEEAPRKMTKQNAINHLHKALEANENRLRPPMERNTAAIQRVAEMLRGQTRAS